MLRYETVEWLEEVEYVECEDVVPGMVVRYEFGDFDHYVKTGVLAMNKRVNGDYHDWNLYGERVSQTDWTTMDNAWGGDGAYELVGYFDLDEYYNNNPEKIQEVEEINAKFE